MRESGVFFVCLFNWAFARLCFIPRMGKGKLLPYSRPHVRPYRPQWSWVLPNTSSAVLRRSPLQLRSEMTYLLPAMKCVEERRNVILESLERSRLQEGVPKQFSGVGLVHRSRAAIPEHILSIMREVDSVASENLVRSGVESFPVKRLWGIVKEYEKVWQKQGGSRRTNVEEASKHGPFPYVEEKAAVLQELTQSQIFKTRHRVTSDSHPKWAIHTIRRRRRKALVRAKKRSISQDSIRTLQAKLLAATHK